MVLRIDGPKARGLRIALRHAWSVRVQRVQKVQRVQRVVDCPGAMLIKSALRDCLPASHRHPERQRRISIKAEYETNAIKYRSVGRLFYAFSLASYVMNNTPVISHLWWLSPFWCLTAPPSPPAVSIGRQKESAFMGRLGALLRPTCTSYAGCAQWTIKLREAIIS